MQRITWLIVLQFYIQLFKRKKKSYELLKGHDVNLMKILALITQLATNTRMWQEGKLGNASGN
jgi:hypothetical protein